MCSYSRFIRHAAVAALLTFVGVTTAHAGVDGQLDTAFGYASTLGKAFINFDDGDNDFDDAFAVAVQPDGKIVVAGNIDYDNGSGPVTAIGVARMLPDGHGLDTTFGTDGQKVLVSPNDSQGVTGIVLQPDGKVLLSGWSQDAGQNKDMLVYRLNASGNADPGFGVLGRAVIPFVSGDDLLQAIALQPDGKIVGAGWVAFSGADHDFAVIRLNTNGQLDTSFDGDGKNTFAFDDGNGDDDRAYALTIDFYGNILLAGSATTSGNVLDFAAARFSDSGARDTSFGNFGIFGGVLVPIGGLESGALSVALSYDALLPIYTLAGFRHFTGNDYDYAAVQLDAYGNVTPGFGVRSWGIDLGANGRDIGRAIVAENFNHIGHPYAARFTIGGFAYNSASGNYDYAALRVRSDGTPDPSFGIDGRTSVAFDYDDPPSTHNDFANAMALQGHRVILAGTVSRSFQNGADADFGITRLTSDIIFDNGFEP